MVEKVIHGLFRLTTILLILLFCLLFIIMGQAVERGGKVAPSTYAPVYIFIGCAAVMVLNLFVIFLIQFGANRGLPDKEEVIDVFSNIKQTRKWIVEAENKLVDGMSVLGLAHEALDKAEKLETERRF